MICLASFSSLTLLHRFKTSKSQFHLTAEGEERSLRSPNITVPRTLRGARE